MADPTKRSDNLDPNNVPGRNTIDSRNRPLARSRRMYIWAWIVGIIIVLLIIWAFFGWNHRTTRVVNPVMQPAAAASSTLR